VASRLMCGATACDNYATPFGVRSFIFRADSGFYLNGQAVKIRGVCLHHDLGALGAAVNTRAIERQLEIMRAMGANAIRTSHNPPAPELLDLTDRMGFIVMDEAFDMWKKAKTPYDYHLDWDVWHVRDLSDMVLRDRNHPSVFIWSIGRLVAVGPLLHHFVADTPNEDAGMIAVAQHHIRQVAHMPRVPIEMVVVLGLFLLPHVERFVHDNEAHPVGQIE